ncbi:hypothetical protein pneo_cds_1079 [Pandoravirus neocaledonia]|uniref:Uncharacterized protein n=1 Tax=Pandoravirus neocaledonia TaxID=2107708 RepID=A0A2U7UE24_9VIRU|nr:hypothetical protein pneo_cds_1079 [Pandoravirus neocaledonia]AVK76686.1 hypothetical protein pneo_cds_1079 [Pandoravirus neocaledonia]
MDLNMCVAHLARRERHVRVSETNTTTADVGITGAGILMHLPSLALEEILYHHLFGEALCAVATALADKNNEDDDVTDVAVLCTWLASTHAPLHGSPEFWCAARRLKNVWPRIVCERFDIKDFAWRGLSPWPRSAGGSVTMVCGPRCQGKTTVATRLARVLAQRVRHVVCVTTDADHPVFGIFSSESAVDDYELRDTRGDHFLDVFDIDRMWQTIGVLVRAHAQEGLLLFVDEMFWCYDGQTVDPLVKEVRDLGVHLVITHQGYPPTGDQMAHLDRILWTCSDPDAQRQTPLRTMCAAAAVDPAALPVADREHPGNAGAWDVYVYQRRHDGTRDLQVMPFARASQ